MKKLLGEISRCVVCAEHLPHEPRPRLAASAKSRILIVGQAPGRKGHESGVPWRDQSGDNLRRWLGVDSEAFYDTDCFALVPMGFCFPGSGKSGDLPPRPEGAPLWHPRLLEGMKHIRLTLLIGAFAQERYLGTQAKENLTETVRRFRDYLPNRLPLPHPSPRNGMWLRRNPWFEAELLPELRSRVSAALAE